ncbi:YraN family protein [Streptomyces sp. NP160]|nr:YraN family protein [Streptomyces sp. NP160]
MSRREVGERGERLAEAHLVAGGAQVLDRNWRCRWGELDLVVRDGDALVGVEVRTRRTTASGTPLESVTPLKVARLRRLLGLWCAEHPGRARTGELRLDVVGVLLDRAGGAEVQHVRGVGA